MNKFRAGILLKQNDMETWKKQVQRSYCIKNTYQDRNKSEGG